MLQHTMYADIVFPLKLSALTYRIPSHAPPDLIGRVVRAPLMARSHYGLVVDLRAECKGPGTSRPEPLSHRRVTIKDVESIHDFFAGRSFVTFLKWLSDYYLAPPGMALKSMFFADSLEMMTESKRRTRKGREHPCECRPQTPDGQDMGHPGSPNLTDAAYSLCKSIEEKTYGSFLFQAPSAQSQYSLLSEVMERAHSSISGAIILVPEIGHIEQLVSLLPQVVGRRVAVLHSRLSRGRRAETLRKIRAHVADVVIGTRSAILAPLRELSFIAVMNEQSPSYKGEEGLRYNGRDVAVMRGFLEKSSVLLSSLCPSVESAYNVLTGKYMPIGIVQDKRAGKQPVPDTGTVGESLKGRFPPYSPRGNGDRQPRPRIRVVDMKEKRFGATSLSRESIEQARAFLAAKEPILFLATRKGYSIIKCADCGHVPACPGCRVPLVFHKGIGTLICHYCGHREGIPGACEKCRGFAIGPSGTGTEKIAEELQDLLKTRPLLVEKRTKRFPIDSPDLQEAGLTPLVVGTLYAAGKVHKGGFGAAVFLNIDPLLSRPDFRAYERAFQEVVKVSQLLKPEGLLLIQTWTPDNRLLRFLRNCDFSGFYEHEFSQRKALGYPPFSKLIAFTVCSKHDDPLLSGRVYEMLDRIKRPQLEVLGPVEIVAPGRTCGIRLRVLLKSKESRAIHAAARDFLSEVGKLRGLQVTTDVDPLKV